jgi:hypothetical protein
MTEFDTDSPVAGVVVFGEIMTVCTCRLEQYPLGMSPSGVRTREISKPSGLPTIVHVVPWIESTGSASTEEVELQWKG